MGGHGDPYKVPHPSIYKVENTPILKEVQDALARQGLRDPWLRNEVWRYDPKHFGTHATRARAFFLRGLFWGTALCAGTIVIESGISLIKGKDKHGHDDHGEHH